MHTVSPLLLGLGLLLAAEKPATPRSRDVAQLREMLHDRQHPQGQSQAALLLVQSTQDGAENAVREGLRNLDNAELFLALAAAVRLEQDRRFGEELLTALASGHAAQREGAAQTLAVVADAGVVTQLNQLAGDAKAEPIVRQTALWTLGRCGSKEAARLLLVHLHADKEDLRRAAASALHDLSGQDYGLEVARWQTWWQRHKEMTNEGWLEARLAYQSSRAHRLADDLSRSRAQLARLQQQLYSRLSPSERVRHIQSVTTQDDPVLRVLAVNWSVELLSDVDSGQQRQLTRVLLRLSQDPTMQVQRAAVLALGRVRGPDVCERLQRMVQAEAPTVRTAALHALSLQARGSEADVSARRREVLPLLQKALDDPVLEVVVAAAEELGTLGVHEASPVLAVLLRHPAGTVRQAAAQTLERIAEPAVLPGLLAALEDSCPSVRFNLVGALAHAAGDGTKLDEEQRKRLLARLEQLLLHDSDPGVRSRAATVLGECASPKQLATLWRCVLAGEDDRVQDKAWTAFVDLLARSGELALLQEWDRTLTAARQGPRRLQLLNDLLTRWHGQPQRKDLLVPVQEMLVQAQLELGKWSAAAPLLRDLLVRQGSEEELNRRLGWLLKAGEQALHEGNANEALRAAEAAQPFLAHNSKWSESFAKLRKAAGR
jgi:HEAT repeat protein